MNFFKKALFFILIFFSLPSQAMLVVTVNSDIDFDQVEYTISNAFSEVRMGTDGTITYTNQFTGSGAGSPGDVLISDDFGRVVDISCRANGRLSDGATTVRTQRAEIVMGAANGVPYTQGTRCRGRNTIIISHAVTTVAGQDTVLIAARIRTRLNNITDGVWHSLFAGGNAHRVWIVRQ